MILTQLKQALSPLSNPQKAQILQKFFKTGKGEYGEGDKFLGIKVPDQRKIAKKYYKEVSLKEIQNLLYENIHEYRLTALFLLAYKFEKAKEEEERKKIADFYIKHVKQVNNWDLVDSSAEKIPGTYLADKNRAILYKFANSTNLWKQRVAIIATYHFIKNNDFTDTLKISKILLDHPHDLIHKAVGWMLREIGKRDKETEIRFLDKHHKKMPRTMLRYAIERFSKTERKKYM